MNRVRLTFGFLAASVGTLPACEPIAPHNLERVEGPMSALPEEEEGGYLIRTDFSDDAAWQATLAAVVARHGIFMGTFHVVDDPANAGASKDEIVRRLGTGFAHSYIFLVDSVTLTHPERPVLVVDLYERPLSEFRAVPSEVGAIQINLSLANMDFEDFARVAGPDGIFRGFEGPDR